MKKLFLGLTIFFLAFTATFSGATIGARGHITTTPSVASAQVPTPASAAADAAALDGGNQVIAAKTGVAKALSLANPLNWLELGLAWIVKWICLGILLLFSTLLGWSGFILNFALERFVLGFGDLFLHQGFGGPVNELWTIIRDLVNITFVFALVYIGITTIVKGDSEAKRMLASVIISALLVNFSLYFAKAIIDVSNLTATTIYSSITTTPAGQGITGTQNGISGAFIARLGVGGLFIPTNAPGAAGTANSQLVGGAALLDKFAGEGSVASIILYTLGVSILFFKLTFAFAFAAFLLIMRFLILIVVMIFAPIAFLPDFLPGFGEARNKWWSTLLNQAFMAPIFLFGLYITLKIISSVPMGQGVDLLPLFTGTGASIEKGLGSLVFFVIGVMMIIMTTALAKSMSSHGSEATIAASGWVEKKVKNSISAASTRPLRAIGAGVTTKPAGYVAKNAVGWSGRQLNRLDTRLKDTRLGRIARGAVTVASLGTLDERTRKKLYEEAQKAKFGNAYSYGENLEHAAKNKKEEDFREKESRALEQMADLAKSNVPFNAQQHTDITTLVTALRKLTQTQLEDQSIKRLTEPNFAMHLSSKQMDYIKESKKFTEADKDAIRKAREQGMVNALTGSTGAGIVRHERDSGELATLPVTVLTKPHMAEHLSSSQMDTISKDTNRTEADKESIRRARSTEIQNVLSYGDMRVFLANKNANEIALFPKNVLEQPDMAQHLNVQTLQALLRNNPNKVRLNTVRQNIQNGGYITTGNWLNNTPQGQTFID